MKNDPAQLGKLLNWRSKKGPLRVGLHQLLGPSSRAVILTSDHSGGARSVPTLLRNVFIETLVMCERSLLSHKPLSTEAHRALKITLLVLTALIWQSSATYAQSSLSIGLLRDIEATPTPSAHSSPYEFTKSSDGVYFLDRSGKLWFSSGTRPGTRQIPLKDLDLGLTLQEPRAMTAWKDTLVFGATFEDPTGNASGCQSSSSTTRSCTSQGLFVVNPHKTGVNLIRGKLFVGDSPDGRPNLPTILTTSTHIIFFGEETHNSGYYDKSLWASDGTRAGTILLNPIDNGGRNIEERVVVGNEVFFVVGEGYSSVSGVWRTNGTKAGTYRWSTASPTTMLSHNGKLYYMTEDSSSRSNYYLLNVFDPLASSSSIPPAKIGAFYYDRSAPNLVPSGGYIYFLVQGSRYVKQQIWRADAISLSLSQVGEFDTPQYLTDFNGTLLFVATDSAIGREVAKYSPQGGVTWFDVRPGLSPSEPKQLTVAAGTLFFSADGGNEGQELWKISPYSTSATLAQDIWPGLNSSKPGNLFGTKTFLIFGADNGQNGIEPWAATSLPLGSFPPATTDDAVGTSGVYASPLAVSGRWNRINFLRYRVSGTSSSREHITILRGYSYSPALSFTTRWSAVSPKGSSWSITLPAKRLRRGTYRWCVRPEGPTSSFGQVTCATLKLR